MSDLFVDTWGAGTPVVLVHGSLATGADEWQAQRPLADEGFRLLVLDRRGYGRSPAAQGEDFLRDADDIADLMGDGAHLVGHSYGGLGVLFAAARRPDATLSLTLLEPGAFTLGQHHPAARTLVADVRRLWDQDLAGRRLGRPVPEGGRERSGRASPRTDRRCSAARARAPPRAADVGSRLPLAELASAAFPKLVVSGGHSAGFDAMCDDLAERIGASRMVVEGAGHEIQFTGPPLNEALLALWRTASSRSASPPSSGVRRRCLTATGHGCVVALWRLIQARDQTRDPSRERSRVLACEWFGETEWSPPIPVRSARGLGKLPASCRRATVVTSS